MPLTRQDALRLLRFCLGPDDSGSVDVADDGAALVTISPSDPSDRGADVRIDDLRGGAPSGGGRGDAQGRVRRAADRVPGRDPPATADVAESLAAARAARPDLFPRVMGAIAALLHETQIERGMSAIFAASHRRIVQARARAPARARRWAPRAVHAARAARSNRCSAPRWRAGSITSRSRCASSSPGGRRSTPAAPPTARWSGSYSAANAELLGLADGALTTFVQRRAAPERARLRRAAVREGEDRHRARAHGRGAGGALDRGGGPPRAGGPDRRAHQLPARVLGDRAAAGRAAARAGARVGDLRRADARRGHDPHGTRGRPRHRRPRLVRAGVAEDGPPR